jgi:hypothetical protein
MQKSHLHCLLEKSEDALLLLPFRSDQLNRMTAQRAQFENLAATPPHLGHTFLTHELPAVSAAIGCRDAFMPEALE